MKKKRTLFFISSLMLLNSGTTIAGDNLHFTGNLISKSCTPVVSGSQLAEVHFPTIAANNLMNLGQSKRVPLVFQLRDCCSSILFNVKVALTGIEDSALPGFLVFDSSSSTSGTGIGIETAASTSMPINNTTGVTLPLNQGSNSLSFNTWLQAESERDVTSGDFSATVTVTFEYFWNEKMDHNFRESNATRSECCRHI